MFFSALLALKRKRYQENLLDQTEKQMLNLEELVHHIQFASMQSQVVDAWSNFVGPGKFEAAFHTTFVIDKSTVIQAMASGLVPVATDACGAAECITHGRDGLVVKSGDAEALAAIFRQLIADPARLEAMRAAAIRTAQEQTWARYGETLHALFSNGNSGTLPRKDTSDAALFRAR